jgi:hypothetical protein
MADEISTIASLATAAGTLVLATATFASIRSANRSARMSERSARIAERSMLAAQRPLLVSSRLQDLPQKIEFHEGNWMEVEGSGAGLEISDGGNEVVYMAISVRNVGTGIAVLHGWHVSADLPAERIHPPLEDFTSQVRDIYIAPADTGLWQGALRDPTAAVFADVVAAIANREAFFLYLLYGNFEGGQRVITQFAIRNRTEKWRTSVARHFAVDNPDPRHLD